MNHDISIGSLNWMSSGEWSVYVSTWVCCNGMWAVSSPTDSDCPKYANDLSGYVVGDWSSKVVVMWTEGSACDADIAVWSGGDEPIAAVEDSIDCVEVECTVCKSTEVPYDLSDTDGCIEAATLLLTGTSSHFDYG